jgi:hypothetical protein
LVEGGVVQAVTLTIGERQYGLRSSTDLTEFRARLTSAVRAGGGMVDIPVAGETGITVLVSPGVSLVLETRDVQPASECDEAQIVPWPSADDLEF